jgi:hypothetical protein
MELIALPLRSSFLLHEHVRSLAGAIIQAMGSECVDGEGAPQKILRNCLICDEFGNSCVLFLLLNGKEVISSALLVSFNQISFRYTPKKHRGKGYATDILRKIEVAWRVTKFAPLWICSSSYMFNSNKRAGWTNDGVPNSDSVTQDWFPPEFAGRYQTRADEFTRPLLDDGYSYSEICSMALKTYGERDGADLDLLLSRWKPFETRKKLQKVSVPK